jgi:hypothetical protein
VTNDATIPNGRSLQDISGVGHSGVELGRVASVTYGMFCAIAGALTLYYRSLGTASTLLRRGNILDKP